MCFHSKKHIGFERTSNRDINRGRGPHDSEPVQSKERRRGRTREDEGRPHEGKKNLLRGTLSLHLASNTKPIRSTQVARLCHFCIALK